VNDLVEEEFGANFKGYQYFFARKGRRLIVVFLLMVASFLGPIGMTYYELLDYYDSTREIEVERMKEITELKKRSFPKIMFENKDFNRVI
jgi:hypothetical protein